MLFNSEPKRTGRQECGCVFSAAGTPVMLCQEALSMRHNLHESIRDWRGHYDQDRRICQICAEYFGHLGGDRAS